MSKCANIPNIYIYIYILFIEIIETSWSRDVTRIRGIRIFCV